MGGMDPYRNLFDGLGFGLSMLIGAWLGFCCFTPIIGHGPPHDLYQALWGVPIGLIAGGVVWKCYVWGRGYQPPPDDLPNS